MAKRKAGLQKKVSSIFEGVSVPKTGGDTPTESSEPVPSGAGRFDRPVGSGPKPEAVAPKPEAAPPKPARADTRRAPVQKRRSGLFPQTGVDDKKQKRMLMLMPVLVIVLTIMLYRTFNTGTGGRGRRVSAKKPVGKAVVNEKSDSEIDWKIPEPYPSTLGDPMRLDGRRITKKAAVEKEIKEKNAIEEIVIEKNVIEESIIVEAIFYSETGRSIVIEDEIFYEGDTILGATIIKINPDSVEFEADGARFSRYVEY